MKKAALYVRVSTSHQIDKDSLPFQRQELSNYSKYLLGIDDFEIFEDAGYSAKNTDRPSYQEMMTRIRNGEFSHLLVWKIDRISRNLKDFTEMYEELKKYDVTFVSKNEQFDTSSAMGEAMLKIILVFAELERKLTAERVYSIMLSRAEKGLWNGAPVPLGYSFDEEKKFPAINEEEAATVRFIFDTYEKFKSTGEVKHRLESNGIRTKKNKHWTSKTISDIIRNPFYIGTYRYNYRVSSHGKIKPESEWVVVEDNHPAIISKEQYEKLNAIMDSNLHGRGTSRSRTHVHIFTGLISCSKCGKNYISSSDRSRANGYKPSVYRCYNYVHSKKDYRICNGIIGEVKLGPFVLNYIANLVKLSDYISIKRKVSERRIEIMLLKGEMFSDIVGIARADLKYTQEVLLQSIDDVLLEGKQEKNIENDSELELLKAEKKKLERALQRLEDLYLFSDEGMAEKDYLLKKQELDKKVEDINQKIQFRAKEYSRNLPGHDLSFIKRATQYLISNNLASNKSLDYNEIVRVIDKKLLQDLMQCIVKKIEVNDDKSISSIEFVNGLKHRFVYRK